MEIFFDTIVTLLDIRFWMFAWVIFIPAEWTWRMVAAAAVTTATGISYVGAKARMAEILGYPEPPAVLAFVQAALASGVVVLAAAGIWAVMRKTRSSQ